MKKNEREIFVYLMKEKNEYYLFLIMSDTERTEINKVLNVVRKLGRRTEKNKREKQIN